MALYSKNMLSKISSNNTVLFLGLLSSFTLSKNVFSSEKVTNSEKPNFLLIVADDAGYSDFSCYGGEIPTPNIDSLAREGNMLTDFHVAPNCAPTRASLLSGVDNHLAGLGTMYELITENQKNKPGYEGYLNFNVVSIAELLKQAGYNTYMAGKWHLGAKKKETRPYARGFQRTFSMLAGGASHWSDNTPLIPGKASPYSVNGEIISKLPKDFYSSKNYADSIISYINKDISSQKPFFAYLSFTAPHNPLHAPKEYIEKYKGKYDCGWEEVAQKRLKRLRKLGLISKDQEAYPYPDWLQKWEDLTAEQKASRTRDMEVYAAMIDYMDMSIGRVITHLKNIGQYENTMIVFISDNGASKTTIMDYASLGGKIEEHIKSFDNSLENKGLPKSSTDIGPGWAWASSTPFRLTKGYPTEGGMRVPCVIKMPKEQKRMSPRLVNGFAYVYDLMPTFLELAKVEYPTEFKGRKILPLQGTSMCDALSGEINEFQEQEFGFEIYGMCTYRSGSWKIIKMPTPYGTGKWQLYNLKTDLSEQNDLSSKHPGVTKKLINKFESYAKNNGVIIPEKPVGYAVPPKKKSY